MKEIHEIAKHLSLLYRYSMKLLSKDIQDIGLTVGQSILLIGVMRNEGQSQKEISDKIFLDSSTASKHFRFLEENNYIYKEIDPKNRRSFLIFITESGKNKALESLDVQNKLWYELFKDIDNDDVLCFYNTVKSINLSRENS